MGEGSCLVSFAVCKLYGLIWGLSTADQCYHGVYGMTFAIKLIFPYTRLWQ